MIIVGIDPGLTGAIGILGHRAEYLGVHDLPTMQRMHAPRKGGVMGQINPAELERLLAEHLGGFDKNELHVFIETPIAFPKQQIQSVASSFLTAGLIEGVVGARHYPHTLVKPADWKKALGLSESKEQARAKAIRLWPPAPLNLVKHHNRAEALLIAKYGHERIS